MTTTLPVPIGELLERLRVEGFSVSPAQYGRLFTVVEAVFPNGLSTETNATDLQALGELIGPIICRTFAEQEHFGTVFNAVLAGQFAQPEPIGNKPVGLVSPQPGGAS
ncbi:MAG: hypothetical protein LH609_17780, partial [Rudanella sp.]|nr:hypothetical protein [Rudanella sp.]